MSRRLGNIGKRKQITAYKYLRMKSSERPLERSENCKGLPT
jgi:hypothetical protein